MLLYWFVIQLVSGFGSLAANYTGGGVAWFAHIGGFLAGMLLICFSPPNHVGAPGTKTNEGVRCVVWMTPPLSVTPLRRGASLLPGAATWDEEPSARCDSKMGPPATWPLVFLINLKSRLATS